MFVVVVRFDNERGNTDNSPQHGICCSLITSDNKLEVRGGAVDFAQGHFPRGGVRQTEAVRVEGLW